LQPKDRGNTVLKEKGGMRMLHPLTIFVAIEAAQPILFIIYIFLVEKMRKNNDEKKSNQIRKWSIGLAVTIIVQYVFLLPIGMLIGYQGI